MTHAQSLNCKGHLIDLSSPIVMGVLNVTPDSFYDGGRYADVDRAIAQAVQMVDEGASIIDVGGMSSRPGAAIIDPAQEIDRVLPVIKGIRQEVGNVPISIDTVHSVTAEACLESGASIINDISGASIDEDIVGVAARYHVPYILMHMRGTPSTMQSDLAYDDVVLEVLTFLKNKVHQLRKLGVQDVIVDPGFGFGKSIDQNYALLDHLGVFGILDCPVLAGVSRKSMIYKYLGVDPEHALNGTTACHMIALARGAHILRAHDVREAIECIKIHQKVSSR